MGQKVDSLYRTYTASVAIAAHLLVKTAGSTANSVAIATAGSDVIGCSTENAIASGAKGAIRLFNGGGTVKLTAAGAIAVNALVYVAGSAGKIDDAVNGRPLGIAMEAATADGDIIEVMPFVSRSTDVKGVAADYAIARGQHTTVAASDTVVTGLATVVSVVASMESDPVDDPFMCSAAKGDQAGAPAAGSVYIKTWKTDGTDPTPAAATTFSKLVNWIAVGTL